VRHYSLLGFFFIELFSYIRSHLRSVMFDCHVRLCYVPLALDICCVLFRGVFQHGLFRTVNYINNLKCVE